MPRLAEHLSQISDRNTFFAVLTVKIDPQAPEASAQRLTANLGPALSQFNKLEGSYYIPSEGYKRGFFIVNANSKSLIVLLENTEIVTAALYASRLPKTIAAKLDASAAWELSQGAVDRKIDTTAAINIPNFYVRVRDRWKAAQALNSTKSRSDIAMEILREEQPGFVDTLESLKASGLSYDLLLSAGLITMTGTQRQLLQAIDHDVIGKVTLVVNVKEIL